tara:strand:- start:63 stop:320 length:258 start_codon:yes stop_codon:yes gene_type:complete
MPTLMVELLYLPYAMVSERSASSSELLSSSSVLRAALAYFNFIVFRYFYIMADSVLLFLNPIFSSSSSKSMFIDVLCLNIEVYPL